MSSELSSELLIPIQCLWSLAIEKEPSYFFVCAARTANTLYTDTLSQYRLGDNWLS